MHQDEDLHDELMKAFNAYFKANQVWMKKGTRVAGMQTRYWLSEIRRICSARRKSIMQWRYDIDAEKRQRKAQNLDPKGNSNDN